MGKQGMFVMGVIVGLLGWASVGLASGSLDGKTFAGQIGKQGQTEGRADGFVFQDGRFESTLCNTFGYGKGDYQAKVNGEATEFTAETASTSGGKMQWKGAVKGDTIEGTTISMENGTTSESWFKGTLKQN